MPSLKERATARVEEVRQRSPFVDHLVRMVRHYGDVKGNLQAGAVTYFAFLSLFPILALAFFAVGWVAKVYPGVEADLVEAIGTVLPGLIGEKDGQLSPQTIKDSASTVGLLGLLGVLYAGLGWLSGMRQSLLVMFETPHRDQPNFVVGKVRDLVSLVLIGVVLVTSVAVSSVISRYSSEVLDWMGLGTELSPLLTVLTVVIGIGTSMLLFYTLFRLLADPELPGRSLWTASLLGALGFEALKQLSSLLLSATRGSPGVQAFGVALILLVWINYTSRLVMYAAAWAQTSREARAVRDSAQQAHALKDAAQVAHSLPAYAGAPAARQHAGGGPTPAAMFAAGGVSMLALMAVVRRLVNPKD